MGRAAKAYIGVVIAVGGLVLVGALSSLRDLSWSWAVFIALTVLASVVKLRLPRVEGTYSLSFLFLLYGIAHFSPAETIVAGCAGFTAQCLLNSKKRSSLVQVLFNCANVSVTVAACFVVGRVWLAAGNEQYLPAVTAVVGCAYFIVNTVLVSGVLSLLQKKPLAAVCGEWYVWSFPYYLIGVTLVGLIPAPGHVVSAEAWLILVPMVYLVHFFLGLGKGRRSPLAADGTDAPLPRAARIYAALVVAAGVVLVATSVSGWQSQSGVRFGMYLSLALIASTFKVKLPWFDGTITPAFVLQLAAIAQLSFAESTLMAAALGVAQILWRPAHRPMPIQLIFNPSTLAVSAAVAWFLGRVALAPWLGHSIVTLMAVSTLALYGSNTAIVAIMVALAEKKPLIGIWQLCYFWSLPYYLVGAVAAGIMTTVSQSANWPPSLLVLPLMALVYISYRMQVSQAVAGSSPAAA